MNEARTIILELLDNKYITKEEALKLLDAIEKPKENDKMAQLEMELKKIGKKLDESFDEVAKKATKTYQKYEPTITDVADKTISKAKDIFEGITKGLCNDKTPKEDEEEDIFEHDEFDK